MIRIKHLLFITLIVFCISICYFCLSYYQEFRRFAEHNVGKELFYEEALVNSNIRNLIFQVIDNSFFVSHNSEMERAVDGYVDQSSVIFKLKDLVSNSPIVEDAVLVDTEGRIISYILGKSEDLLPTKTSIFTDAYNDILSSSGESQNFSGRLVFFDSKDGLGKETSFLAYIHPVTNQSLAGKSNSIGGFLISSVPLLKLISVVSSTSNTNSVVRASGRFLFDLEGYLTRYNSLEIKDHFDKVIGTLRVSVSRKTDAIEESILDSIVSQIKKNIFISVVIAIALVICFLYILHSFDRLFILISRLEMNNRVFTEKFTIWEFNKTSRLLHDMKSTILNQLHDIERKNQGLEKANNETAEVNRKLSDMNATLEKQVKERTLSLQKALELSTRCNNISNVIIEQRSKLKDDMKSVEIFEIFCSSIEKFALRRNFAFQYKMEGENREKFNNITMIIPKIDMEPGEQYRYEKGFYLFPLSMKEGVGFLSIESLSAPIDNDILTNILVFCREVSSYLDNRALRNRLSFWARTDGLTKLGNRVAYDQQMAYYETCLDSEIGLFLIDVNGLKEMNDNKGHSAGDALLKRVATKLQSVFDDYDADIFRIGGDEFITILHGKDLNKSAEILTKLSQVQDKPIPRNVNSAEISATFAVGYADSHNTPFQLLYKKADHEMYIQKEAYYEMRYKLFGEVRAPRH